MSGHEMRDDFEMWCVSALFNPDTEVGERRDDAFVRSRLEYIKSIRVGLTYASDTIAPAWRAWMARGDLAESVGVAQGDYGLSREGWEAKRGVPFAPAEFDGVRAVVASDLDRCQREAAEVRAGKRKPGTETLPQHAYVLADRILSTLGATERK